MQMGIGAHLHFPPSLALIACSHQENLSGLLDKSVRDRSAIPPLLRSRGFLAQLCDCKSFFTIPGPQHAIFPFGVWQPVLSRLGRF
jgi:hypothetical protein